MDIPIIKYLPAKYQGIAIVLILAAPYVCRGYHALANGGGLKGIWNAIMFGTNTPKPSTTGNVA